MVFQYMMNMQMLVHYCIFLYIFSANSLFASHNDDVITSNVGLGVHKTGIITDACNYIIGCDI